MGQTYTGNTADNERKKFRDAGSSLSAVAVVGAGGESLSGSMWTLPYDYVGAAYPDTETEVYTTKLGGSSGSIQEVITVIYTDSTKENLSSVERA